MGSKMIRSNDPIVEFLNSVESIQFRNNIKSSLKLFNHICKKNVFELKIDDIVDYQEDLNDLRLNPLTNKPLCLSSKRVKLDHVKKFVKFLLKHYKDKYEQGDRLEFKYDLKDKNYFTWKEDQPEPNTAFKREVMTKEELKAILTYLNDEKPVKYLMFRILAESGMRKGEVLSIDMERNVEGKIIPIEEDLKNRFLRVRGKKGLMKYFISKELSEQLLYYLHNVRDKRVQKYSSNTKALFISQKGNRFHPSVLNQCLLGTMKRGEYRRDKTWGVLRKLNIERHITPQTFRRTLNTHRKNKGCPTEEREVLINHKSKSVNINFYSITDDQQFRELFDTWNPYDELFHDLKY